MSFESLILTTFFGALFALKGCEKDSFDEVLRFCHLWEGGDGEENPSLPHPIMIFSGTEHNIPHPP